MWDEVRANPQWSQLVATRSRVGINPFLFLRNAPSIFAPSIEMRLSRAVGAVLKCTCQHQLPYARAYATTLAPPAPDKLISAARKLIELSNSSTDNAIEASKRKKELEELRSALSDVEEGTEVSQRRAVYFAAHVHRAHCCRQ